jgi:hypothetical protein
MNNGSVAPGVTYGSNVLLRILGLVLVLGLALVTGSESHSWAGEVSSANTWRPVTVQRAARRCVEHNTDVSG